MDTLVLSKPLSLLEGTQVIVQIDPIDPEEVGKTNDDQNTTTDEGEDFASLPFFGMWADRENMQDSVAWVRKQRKKWSERITRTE